MAVNCSDMEEKMHYRARQQVIQALKQQAQKVQGLPETAFYEGNGQGGQKGAFTLRSVPDNLFAIPARRHLAEFAAGRNVWEGMAYLGSSTAMLYNMLGNETIQMPDGEYRIFFRQRLHTLNRKNACTTVDAILLSEYEKSAVCMSAKLLEWFSYQVNPLRDTFLHYGNYGEPAAAECFVEAFRQLIPFYERDAYEHVGSLKLYDGFFVLRQLLALYHAICEKRFFPIEKLNYISIYWRPLHPALLGSQGIKLGTAAGRMEREAELFLEQLEPVIMLFRETLDVKLQVQLMHMWEFLEETGADAARRAWMKRYEI